MKDNEKTDIRSRLSALWTVLMMNMVFADIYSIMVELVDKDTLAIPGNVKVVMAVAAVVTNIPILMIYFSRVLPRRTNRLANLIAGCATLVYIVGGGSLAPHYLVAAAIEVAVLLAIMAGAWKWTGSGAEQKTTG